MTGIATRLELGPTGSDAHTYFYHIDIIRFICALMVASFHFCYISSVTDFGILWPFTWFGWVGVEVFFVISGLVIANSANGSEAGGFVKGRLLRLYPSDWICASITLIVAYVSGGIDLVLPYIRSMVLSPKGPWISTVYWTLSVEISFYGVIFVMLIFRNFNRVNRLAAALASVSAIYLFATTFGFLREQERFNVILIRHGCFFAIGIWIWLSTVRPLSLGERLGVGVAVLASMAEIRLTALKFLPRERLSEGNILVPIVLWCIYCLCDCFFHDCISSSSQTIPGQDPDLGSYDLPTLPCSRYQRPRTNRLSHTPRYGKMGGPRRRHTFDHPLELCCCAARSSCAPWIFDCTQSHRYESGGGV